uniref:WAP domain-containing protein n=1 Tax=Coptotermes formosanus TaxID=36987 RepID=R4UV05_COPFO|nr:hypothetical protein [Coptotermes formosanus]
MARRTLPGFILLLVILTACCSAYNDDRPIYKWSPLWFSRYFRNAQLYKRGPPIQQEAQDECVPENQRCGYWGLEIPCCDSGHCIMDHCVSEENLDVYKQGS